MTRSNRFVFWWLGRQGVPALGFVAVLALLLVLLYDPTNVSPLWTNLRQYTGIIVWLVAMLLPATLYMSGLPMAAGMGATRRGFFLASQITKLPCALLAGVLAWLAGGLNAVAGGIAAGLLAACLAELLGTICIRFGSKASAIFVILCALLGGMLGAAGAMSSFFPFLADLAVLLGAVPVALASLAGAVAVTAAAWGLLRNMDLQF